LLTHLLAQRMTILLRKLFSWITLLLYLTRLFKGAAQLCQPPLEVLRDSFPPLGQKPERSRSKVS
jgi:hypothetical protein